MMPHDQFEGAEIGDAHASAVARQKARSNGVGNGLADLADKRAAENLVPSSRQLAEAEIKATGLPDLSQQASAQR